MVRLLLVKRNETCVWKRLLIWRLPNVNSSSVSICQRGKIWIVEVSLCRGPRIWIMAGDFALKIKGPRRMVWITGDYALKGWWIIEVSYSSGDTYMMNNASSINPKPNRTVPPVFLSYYMKLPSTRCSEPESSSFAANRSSSMFSS